MEKGVPWGKRNFLGKGVAREKEFLGKRSFLGKGIPWEKGIPWAKGIPCPSRGGIPAPPPSLLVRMSWKQSQHEPRGGFLSPQNRAQLGSSSIPQFLPPQPGTEGEFPLTHPDRDRDTLPLTLRVTPRQNEGIWGEIHSTPAGKIVNSQTRCIPSFSQRVNPGTTRDLGILATWRDPARILCSTTGTTQASPNPTFAALPEHSPRARLSSLGSGIPWKPLGTLQITEVTRTAPVSGV